MNSRVKFSWTSEDKMNVGCHYTLYIIVFLQCYLYMGILCGWTILREILIEYGASKVIVMSNEHKHIPGKPLGHYLHLLQNWTMFVCIMCGLSWMVLGDCNSDTVAALNCQTGGSLTKVTIRMNCTQALNAISLIAWKNIQSGTDKGHVQSKCLLTNRLRDASGQ